MRFLRLFEHSTNSHKLIYQLGYLLLSNQALLMFLSPSLSPIQNEIINTCRDNIRCLEAVLRGPPGTVLSTQCAGQTKGESLPPGCRLIATATATGHQSAVTAAAGAAAAATPMPIVECKCAPITRFVARLIDFVLDVGNLLEHFTLYRFLAGTLRTLYALVNRPMGRLERLFAGFRGLL